MRVSRAGQDVDALHREVGDRLRSAGQVYTAGRRHLVELLGGISRPATIPELVGSSPELALSSAYRNVAVLEQVGVIARIVSSGEHARFELAEPVRGDHHHHLICESCGRVDDFTLPASVERSIERASAEVATEGDFLASSHRVDLLGTCGDCVTVT